MDQTPEQKDGWYYSVGSARYGPVDIDRVRRLPPETPVWHPDLGDDWVILSEIPALAPPSESEFPERQVDRPVGLQAGETVRASEHLTAAVRNELDRMTRKQKHPIHSLILLLLSLALFAAIAVLGWISFTTLAAILMVLLVHEMGHYVGMKIFGYRDIKMFLIPMLGAAVAGSETAPTTAKRATVSLLGPAPGILLGLICGGLFFIQRNETLALCARVFIGLNLLNLLPFHPLDGGRLFETLLFSRSPRAEIIFKLITGILLLLVAVLTWWIPLAIVAGFVLLALPITRTAASIAAQVRKEMPPGEGLSTTAIPDDYLSRIVGALAAKQPASRNRPGLFAINARSIWQRICTRHSSTRAHVALMLAYVLVFLVGLAGGIGFEAAKWTTGSRTELTERKAGDGTSVLVASRYASDVKVSESEVNEHGRFHGKHTGWVPIFGCRIKTEEGWWENGYRHGAWRYFDPKGDVREACEYDEGSLVEYKKMKKGSLRTVPREDWPRHVYERARQNGPQGVDPDDEELRRSRTYGG